MEDFVSCVNSMLGIVNSFEAELNKKSEESLAESEKIVNAYLSDKSKPSGKRAKRLQTITDIEVEDSITSTISIETDKSLKSNTTTNENVNNSQYQGRSVRAAKLKTLDSLKEASLKAKIRQGSNHQSVVVKKEKLSALSELNHNNLPRTSNGNTEKRKSDDTNDNESSKKVKVDNSLEIITNADAAPVVEILSDDDVDKMPPPTILPSKKRGRLLKNGNESVNSKISVTSSKSPRETQKVVVKLEKIKHEKSSLESVKSNGTNKSKKKTRKTPVPMIIKEERSSIKMTENENITEEINDQGSKNDEKRMMTRNTESKNKTKSNGSVYEDAVTEQTNNSSESNKNNNNCNSTVTITTNNISKEDETDKIIQNSVVRIEKLKKHSPIINKTPELITNTINQVKAADATFVSAVSDIAEEDKKIIQSDATFVADEDASQIDHLKAKTTFVVNKQVEKGYNTNAKEAFCDETFDVNSKSNVELKQAKNRKDQNYNVDNSNDNLITEDEDVEEELPKKQKQNTISKLLTSKKLKNKNELFSPFVQSPVKKKVEAFEKHATDTASPIPQRQTRTKTRLKQQLKEQETNDNENKKELGSVTGTHSAPIFVTTFGSNFKSNTPVILSRLGKVLTPTQSNITPTQPQPYKKVIPSSTSKVQTLQKTSSLHSIASSKGSSLSQENVSDKLDSKTKIHQLVEEKRKLREMKAQMVLKSRDIKDKERHDKLKKQLEEKEEKQRKIEMEKKKIFEEAQIKVKSIEEGQRKQKQIEAENAARKEKEQLEKILKTKEYMKIKYQQNQLQQQQQNHQAQQKKESKNIVIDLPKMQYDFDMLDSDDSTDDEDKVSKKRPNYPTWSKKTVRQFYIDRQTTVPTKIIDNFFSVRAMTPNLKKIFPEIDPSYLKRNSSVVWKTPPRYSELPKY